jgi:hypothetical protein
MSTEKTNAREAALGGLVRLATGQIGDVAKLVCGTSERSDRALAAMDLYAVSELKRGKDGWLEVKLHDRLKALELLLSHAGGDDGPCSFYAALDAAVSRMGEGGKGAHEKRDI